MPKLWRIACGSINWRRDEERFPSRPHHGLRQVGNGRIAQGIWLRLRPVVKLHYLMPLHLELVLHHYLIVLRFINSLRTRNTHIIPRILQLNVLTILAIEGCLHQALCHVRVGDGLLRRFRLGPALECGEAGFVGRVLPPRAGTEEVADLWEADDEVTRGKLTCAPEEDLGLPPGHVFVAAVLDPNGEADGREYWGTR